MPAFERQQSRTQSGHRANSAKQDRSSFRPALMENPLMTHHQALGIQAMQRLLNSDMIQAKPTINEPGDEYEQEADQVADAVMRKPDPETTKGATVSGQVRDVCIQRMCSECEEKLHRRPTKEEGAVLGEIQASRIRHMCSECEEELHRQPMEEEEEEEKLQAKGVCDHTPRVTPDVQSQINSMRGGGQPLPKSMRGFFESRFGYDFSQVRVHTDARAAELARAVNALAFTVGRDVVFGAGQYAPGTIAGKKLLAHELAHVVQQGSNTVQANAEINQPGDAYEQEADWVANTVVGNAAVSPIPDIRRWRALPMVLRTVSERGIKDGKFSYSTHCGWIDWGHSNPAMARRLINDVRAASARLRSTETARSEQPGAPVVRRDQPGIGLPDVCPSQYETEEREASSKPQAPLFERRSFPTHEEVYLYGFEVDRSDASRFSVAIGEIANELAGNPSARTEIYGFTDCIGTERRNLNLRAERALAVQQMLPENVRNRIPVVTFAALDRYLADNTSREGRRRNRAVAIKILPPLAPERAVALQESGVRVPGGIAGVNAVALVANILRPLSPDQELEVALGIFLRVSWAFEEAQFSTDWVVESSFSEEDLPSNLLGFYRAARGLSRADVERACDAWDVPRSVAQFKGYQFDKNLSFFPRRLPAGGAWPAQFRNIREEPPGQLWEVREVVLRIPGHTFRTCFNAGVNVPCR